jgi:hypothetical protein
MYKEPKVGDKILAVEVLERTFFEVKLRFSYGEIIKVGQPSWEAKILNVLTLESYGESRHKLICIERYFEGREFHCPLQFSSHIFCYTFLNKEDELFIDAIFSIPEENKIWKRLANKIPSQIIQVLKPYILSKLGRK